ncbi:discoidin domain-containing protein [Pontibacter sp. G13]|uniref:galactose-binding domain-containing protein n=1 Tax=Pontibacter sp. G13 TaxID=3074898 RepID=UPI0028899615|nr:discoidin domain-containing protein [Pontibacter sp. G13]WNJ19296.1 discoidin domain-containing protein [Pontibacter sp. G13]
MTKNFTLVAMLVAALFQFGQAQNIALNKTAFASTEELPAAFAVDGDMNTRWGSQFADPEWITIDLGQVYNIGQVVLHWEGAFGQAYEIQVSNDTVNWTTLFAETNGDGGLDAITVSGSGQYVRMYGTVRATQWGYSLWEMEVYEPTAAGSDATLMDLRVDGVTLPDFTSIKTDYNYALVGGETVIPTVEATPTDSNAFVAIQPTGSLPGMTAIIVTSADSSVVDTYAVNFVYGIPAVGAPIPPHDSANVISVYSDTYTSIVTEINPNWGQATITTEEQLGGNNTLRYGGLNYQGMSYPNTDVSEMEYLHIDYFTGDATDLNFFLISPGAENPFDIDQELGIVTGEWVSLDIPLTHYTVPDLTDVFQFKTDGNGTVYFDNFYFWKTADATSISETVLKDLKVFPNPATDFVQIDMTAPIEMIQVYDLTGKVLAQYAPVSTSYTLDMSNFANGLYFLQVQAAGATGSVKILKQ